MNKNVLEGVPVIDIADKGKALGKLNDKAIFIDGAVPGDLVDVEITKKSKSFDEGRVFRIVEPSPHRDIPFCEHFGLCGGCKWQHMQYNAQIKFKEKLVRDVMQRIAKIPDPPVNPILGGPSTTHYRNKLEFTFTNKRYLLKEEMNEDFLKEMNGLGFHIPGKFNKVLDIHKCHLQDNRSNEIRNFVKSFAIQHQFTFFDLKSQVGLMRNLIIRNTSLDEWMVVVVFKEDILDKREMLLSEIMKQFPWITSLQYVINPKRNDTIHDQQTVVYHGKPFIVEQLEDLKFKVGPKSFFQTNTQQALNLYRITRDFAGLNGNEIVYDLYTGTGSIAAFLSAKAKIVIGVEYVADAIRDARENAELNNITNMKFIAGDMKDVLTASFFTENGNPDVIITDPPRAGMHEAVVKRILDSGAGRIVYVSCNPSTQARDILLLMEKYKVVKMQPVDMFPHTAHVENVVVMER